MSSAFARLPHGHFVLRPRVDLWCFINISKRFHGRVANLRLPSRSLPFLEWACYLLYILGRIMPIVTAEKAKALSVDQAERRLQAFLLNQGVTVCWRALWRRW